MATSVKRSVEGPELAPMPGSVLRMLAAVCLLYGRDGRVTIEGLVSELGFSSNNATTAPLNKLKELGLIRKDAKRAASIVPLCSLILYPGAFRK